MAEIKSLRELSEELLQVRLSATNSSLWAIAATIEERAQVALNQAVGEFPIHSQGVYTSIRFPGNQGPIAIPSFVESVQRLEAVHHTGGGVTAITHHRHVPTEITNYLYMYNVPGNVTPSTPLNMEYTRKLEEFPADLFLVGGIDKSADLGGFQISGGVPIGNWPSEGFLELTPITDTGNRELMYYHSASVNTIIVDLRAIGSVAHSFMPGARVSFAQPMNEQQKAVIMAAAEGEMYNFWHGHQAQYDRFISASGLQQLDTATILTLARARKQDAERARLKTRKLPPAGKKKHRGRRR